MKRIALVVLSIALAACGSAPEPTASTTPPPATAPPLPAPVPDHTSIFPDAGKLSAVVVPDHLLDMKKMPGGSLAEYNVKGRKYSMFVIDVDSNQSAAFLMLDMKAEMNKDPDYISWMGGYFGTYRDKPLYCFAKLHYLAGIVGLTKDQADPLARNLAAQLH